MNNKQRTKLQSVVSELEIILSEEQEKLDNLEENFAETERYKIIEEGVYALQDAIDNLQTAMEN